MALEKLAAQRAGLLNEFAAVQHGPGDHCAGADWQTEIGVLRDETLAQRWLAQLAPLLTQVPAASSEQIYTQFKRPGTLVFEGAQGVLLDEWRGFHPHTSWSSINRAAVAAVLADAACDAPVTYLGVLRAYLTRHGNGPLPTEDASLDCLAEPHNRSDGWQGRFRRGQPDAVMLRYALAVAGQLDGLVVSHLDVFDPAGQTALVRGVSSAGGCVEPGALAGRRGR